MATILKMSCRKNYEYQKMGDTLWMGVTGKLYPGCLPVEALIDGGDDALLVPVAMFASVTF